MLIKIDYATKVTDIGGTDLDLERFRGRVLLIVNTASRCGYTHQYRDLETLYRNYQSRGFFVLGFPCNQFGRQEPGSEEVIAKFCTDHYDVTFPMFSKIEVNGPNTHLLYRQLKSVRRKPFGTRRIQWNFNKFLISSDGSVRARYGSNCKPKDLEKDIEEALEMISK